MRRKRTLLIAQVRNRGFDVVDQLVDDVLDHPNIWVESGDHVVFESERFILHWYVATYDTKT